MTSNTDSYFIQRAIELAHNGAVQNEGGPFGAVIVKEGQIIGKGNNKVVSTNDPTAHAEILAIREACQHLSSYQLTGCTIYTSCEPCPMCLGAIYWARPDRIVYACTRQDAATINFDDEFIYKEILLPLDQRKIPAHQCEREQGLSVFRMWENKTDKVEY
jgi:tRNA(Arg) A34 adenosine deaminase TadA